MGIFTSLFRRDTANHALASVTYDQQVLDYMQGGTTREQASAVAAIYRCRTMTTDTMSSIPVEDRITQERIDRAPNPEQTMQEFVAETVRSLIDCGDAYWERTEMGNWYVRNPSMMSVKWTDQTARSRGYWYRQRRLFPGVNLRVVSLDRGVEDLTGYGPMQSSRVKGMLAEQKFAEEYYLNNATPVGTLQVPRTLEASEAEKLKQQWTAAQATRSPAVLSGGMEWTATGFNATDSDWVEAHRESVGDTCRLFGVPGAILGYNTPGSSLSYANVGDLHEQWWRNTLYPTYAKRIEENLSIAMQRPLRFDPQEFFLASLHNRSMSARQLVDAGYDRDDVLDAVGFKPMGTVDVLPTTLQKEPESAQETP